MKVRTLLLTGTIVGIAVGATGTASAQSVSTSDQIRTQQAQIDYLKRQVQLLQDSLQTLQVAEDKTQKQIVAAKPAPNAVTASLANGRPQFQTADGNFRFNIQGKSQTDYANYFGLPPGLQLNNGVNERRAYIGLDGIFYQDWEGFLEADLGNSGGNENKTTGYLRSARLSYSAKNAGLGNLAFDIGYMEINNDFERAISSTNTFFMERSSPEQIAASVGGADRRFGAGARDYGNSWFADLYYTGARTGIGNTNSVTTNRITNEGSQVAGRVTFLPWQDENSLIHIGVNGQYAFSPDELSTASAAPRRTLGLSYQPGINVDSTAFINTQANNSLGGSIPVNSGAVLGGELAGEWKNLAIFAQYYYYLLDTTALPAAYRGATPTLAFDAFDINFSYILTGESRGYDKSVGSFGAVRPAKNFNPATGDWGALELVARFEQTNLNDSEGGLLVEGGRQTLYELGLSWYPNANIRFLLQYTYADIQRALVSGTGPAAYLVAPTRGSNLQPDFSSLAFRSQFAF